MIEHQQRRPDSADFSIVADPAASVRLLLRCLVELEQEWTPLGLSAASWPLERTIGSELLLGRLRLPSPPVCDSRDVLFKNVTV